MKRALKWLAILDDKEAHDTTGEVYKVDNLQLQVDMFKVLTDFLVKNKRSKDEDEERAMAAVPGVEAMRAVISEALDARLGKKGPRIPLPSELSPAEKAREERVRRAQGLAKDFNPRNARTYGAADDSALAAVLERGSKAFGYPEGWEPEEEGEEGEGQIEGEGEPDANG